MDLGDAHGVTAGSVYGVHATILDPGPNNPQLCTLIVTKVEPLHSIMEFPDEVYDIPELFYARKLTNGPGKPFTVYCSEQDLIEKLFPNQQSRDDFGINVVSSPASADLSIFVDQTANIATFERHNPFVTSHIGSRFPFPMSIDNHSRLRHVIECAVNFERHLKRSGEDMRNIWMELREVEFEPGSMTPRMGQNLLENDTAIVPVNRSFTLTIFNQTSLRLYPHVFYLDPSELSIGTAFVFSLPLFTE